MHRHFILFLSLLSLCTANAAAQYSPYRLSPAADIPLGAGAFVGYGISHYFSRKVKPLSADQIQQLNRNDIWAFDRSATRHWSPPAANISDGLLIGGILSPALLMADPDIRPHYKEVAMMGFETFFVTNCLTDLSKQLVKRTRPLAYNPDAPMLAKQARDARFSFFSGHTSVTAAMSFYTAKVYSDFHPDSRSRYWVWAGAAILPAATGYMRYRAGKHFPTDILVGYLVGAASGILIPELHRHIR